MPHVVIEDAGDLQRLYQAFTPIVHRTGNEILKVQEFYLARSGKEALLESVAIEQVLRAISLSRSSCTRKRSPSVYCRSQIPRKLPQSRS
jgi:hypothetical protein